MSPRGALLWGALALALGLVAAAQKMGKPLFYGAYPITPATDILHFLAPLRHFDVRTFQAEDEIAAINMTIGASFAGVRAMTATSGPGLSLMVEASFSRNDLTLRRLHESDCCM